MDYREIADKSIGELLKQFPYAEDFFISAGIEEFREKKGMGVKDFLYSLSEEKQEDLGIASVRIMENFQLFIHNMEKLKKKKEDISSITIRGGVNKLGKAEEVNITITKGNIISIVGPTGSGKSRLLADIECLAQRDTQTKRQILVNDTIPADIQRFSLEHKLIAQLSQNMNFVMDLPVGEFLKLHGESRMISNVEAVCEMILADANELAGEEFTGKTPLTQLSGGQSRALMIADTALLSSSPIILIDEIENAGVDRKKALSLLVKKEKIVLMSTHDPMLALMGDKRIIIENGGIKKVIETSREEKGCLNQLEKMDKAMVKARNLLRAGHTIEFSLECLFQEEEV
jgi:ABC-type lipoprotein export system ATPase subunit